MKLLILIAFLIAQPPKWKYIVFYNTRIENAGMPRYDASGKIMNRYTDYPEWKPFATSKAAWKYFNDGITKRNGLIYFNGSLVNKVWIDSIQVK